MTKLEYYELLVKTSLEGGFPARVSEGMASVCKYRCEDGKKCAIGLIMPDGFYRPDMEGRAVNRVTGHTIPDWFPEGVDMDQVMEIQAAHDGMTIIWRHERFVGLLKNILRI